MKQMLVMAAMSVLALSGATAENKSHWADLAPDGVFCPGEAVLFVGDSITHGGRMGDMNHYLGHGYQAEIASRYLGYRPEMDLCFFNRGVSGDDTRKLLGRWERDVINLSANESGWTAAFPRRTGRQKPDVISIMVGINDFRRCRAGKNSGGITHVEYEANIEKLVAMTRKAFPRARIVMCEPVNLIAEEAEDFAVWRSAVRNVATRDGLCFVDFQRLFDEVLLKENPHRGYWFWDQYHPTYAAHMRMADWWIAEVRWQTNEEDPEVVKRRQWIAKRWRENDGCGNPVGEIGEPFPMDVPLPWIEKDSYDWFQRHNSRVGLARTANPQIVFIGDSITHGWEMNDRRGDAKASFERWFGRYSTLNLGFGWDRIQNVLWRLEHGEMDGANPKVVVIHIGTNNTAPGYKYNAAPNPPGEIADGILAVCRKVRKIAPKARIVLMKVFPRGRTSEDPYRAKVAAINAELDRRLADFHDDRLTVIDMYDKFVDADGNISLDLTIDYLHPTAKGYDLWGAELAPIIDKECGYERLERVARLAEGPTK